MSILQQILSWFGKDSQLLLPVRHAKLISEYGNLQKDLEQAKRDIAKLNEELSKLRAQELGTEACLREVMDFVDELLKEYETEYTENEREEFRLRQIIRHQELRLQNIIQNSNCKNCEKLKVELLKLKIEFNDAVLEKHYEAAINAFESDEMELYSQ